MTSHSLETNPINISLEELGFHNTCDITWIKIKSPIVLGLIQLVHVEYLTLRRDPSFTDQRDTLACWWTSLPSSKGSKFVEFCFLRLFVRAVLLRVSFNSSFMNASLKHEFSSSDLPTQCPDVVGLSIMRRRIHHVSFFIGYLHNSYQRHVLLPLQLRFSTESIWSSGWAF